MNLLDFANATGKRRKDLIGKAWTARGVLQAVSHETRILLCLLADGEVPPIPHSRSKA